MKKDNRLFALLNKKTTSTLSEFEIINLSESLSQIGGRMGRNSSCHNEGCDDSTNTSCANFGCNRSKDTACINE